MRSTRSCCFSARLPVTTRRLEDLLDSSLLGEQFGCRPPTAKLAMRVLAEDQELQDAIRHQLCGRGTGRERRSRRVQRRSAADHHLRRGGTPGNGTTAQSGGRYQY